jgi:D-lactate dehydrogenase
MTVVLPSGTVVDTAAPGTEEEFEKKEPSLAKGLMDLRNELLADPELVERIKRKYSHRSTNGYGIRSFPGCRNTAGNSPSNHDWI